MLSATNDVNKNTTTLPLAARDRAALLIGLSLLVACTGARAEDPDIAAGATDPGERLQEVVVSATRNESPLLEVPASATVVSEDDLDRRHVTRFGDALAEVPGLYVRGSALGLAVPGSGQAVLSLRGIPRTPRTLVLVDGLPINNALSGGVNVAGIAIDNVERVEVLRGPHSALWGGNSMGGVINFITGSPDRPLAEVRAGVGSDGLRSGNAILRKRFEGGLGVSMSLGYRTTDGYPDSDYVVKTATPGAGGLPVTGARPTFDVDGTPAWWVGLKGRRPWTQQNAQASFDWSLGHDTRLAAGFGWGEYTVGYDEPDTFLAGPGGAPVFAGTVALPDGGGRIALAERDFLTATPAFERDFRLFARLEHRFEGGSLLKLNLGRLEHRFSFATAGRGAGYVSGPGELTAQPNDRTDLDVSWRNALGESTILTAGFALNHSTLDRTTRTLDYWRDEHTAGALLTGVDAESDNAALFAQTETLVGEHGRLVLGARYDRFSTSGTVIDTAAGLVQEHEKRSFSRLSPKAAFSWQARDGLNLRGSLGTGFRPPALLDLYSRFVVPRGTDLVVFDASPDLKPERVLSLDLGADARLAGGAQGSVTVYAQKLRDLIYRRTISPTLTRPDNTGEARVDGIEASLRAPAGPRGLWLAASFTHNFRYEVTRNDALPASVGKKLTDVPETMWSLAAEYESGPWSALLAYRRVSHVFGSSDDMNLNTTQGVYESYDRYGVASARVQYRFGPQVFGSLSIDNLTDEEYFVFSKQPGRTVFAELGYRF